VIALAEETPVAESSGGSNRLLIIIVIVQTVAIAGLFYLVMPLAGELKELKENRKVQAQAEQEFNKENETLTTEEEERKGTGPTVKLGQLVVNLRGLDNRNHVLRTSLDIEVDNEETRREVESNTTQIRYLLLSLLQNRRPNEVLGQNQLELLRESMKRTAGAVLTKGKIVNVWPSSWIME
jgi:flagellar basal body-associated protein FliL